MEDFKDMYIKLYDKVTSAVNNLQWALWEGEETYFGNNNPHIIELFNDSRKDDFMNIYTIPVCGAGKGISLSPAIILCPPWLPDMGFTPGALVQILPESGGMLFILCDKNIRKYSELLRATEEKKGMLTTVSGCRAGIRLEIEGFYIHNAGLDVGDTLIVQYEYGLIRVRKLSEPF